MHLKKILCGGLVCFALTSAVWADPESKTTTLKRSENAAITRNELVGEIETVLTRWEDQSGEYATKSDLADLRAILLQMRKELSAGGERQGESTEKLDTLDQRLQNLRRPGF